MAGFTQADVDSLQAAIAGGIQQVTYADGRTVRFQNADQMLAALELMRSDVASATAKATGYGRRRLTIARMGRCR